MTTLNLRDDTLHRNRHVYFVAGSDAAGVTYTSKQGVSTALTGAKLLPSMQAVYVTTSGALTLYLPDVTEMAGTILTVTADDQASGDLIVADNDESFDWSDLTLGDNDDGVCLFSDGRKWWILTDDYT